MVHQVRSGQGNPSLKPLSRPERKRIPVPKPIRRIRLPARAAKAAVLVQGVGEGSEARLRARAAKGSLVRVVQGWVVAKDLEDRMDRQRRAEDRVEVDVGPPWVEDLVLPVLRSAHRFLGRRVH